MDLTPELLLEAKFSSARRGYDMHEVDDFLERCAEGLDVLLSRLKSEFERAERAEDELGRREPLPPGTDTGDVAHEVVPDELPTTAAAEESMRILIAAERTAESAVSEARGEAERLVGEARTSAETLRADAEALLERSRAEAEAESRRAGEETRREVESEVLALRRDRDTLANDVRLLRRWLDDQRGRLRIAARDLQRLVEDPAALRQLPVPELRADGPLGLDAAVAAELTTDVDEPEPSDEPDDDSTADDSLPGPSDAAPDDVSVDLRDLSAGADADGAGEPTQAVPVAVFDDEVDSRDRDGVDVTTASPGGARRGGDPTS